MFLGGLASIGILSFCWIANSDVMILSVLMHITELFLMTAFVGKSALAFQSVIGKILEFSPLRYLGRISYGIYLYHMPIYGGLMLWGWSEVQTAVAASGVTLVIAIASWHLLEKPILKFKDSIA